MEAVEYVLLARHDVLAQVRADLVEPLVELTACLRLREAVQDALYVGRRRRQPGAGVPVEASIVVLRSVVEVVDAVFPVVVVILPPGRQDAVLGPRQREVARQVGERRLPVRHQRHGVAPCGISRGSARRVHLGRATLRRRG